MSNLFPGRKEDQIKLKWQSFLKVAVSKAPWSTSEDILLIQILKERGNKRQWKEIANELNSRSGSEFFRHGKQCRERWINHLDPSVNRGAWTTEEDIKLLQSIIGVGKRWAEIAKRVGQRTENSVKNRWSSILRKCKNEFDCDNLSDGGDDTDRETCRMKKLAQMALQLISQNRSLENEESGLSLLKVANKESKQKQNLELEELPASKETSKCDQFTVGGELDLLNQQQLNPALLTQLNNEFNQNFLNQNLPLNSFFLNSLPLYQVSEQFSELATPKNKVQQQGRSPNVETFLQNWQSRQGISGASPMSQSLGVLSPISNSAAFSGILNYPPLPHHNTCIQRGNQSDVSDLRIKERFFEDFSESLISNHNLQFALVDISNNEIYYLTGVTKANYAPCLGAMKCEKNLQVNCSQRCSLESSTFQVGNPDPVNTYINSLNRDLANLVITPKLNTERGNELIPSSSFAFLSSLQ